MQDNYDFSGLICPSWRKNIDEWLKEDLPSFDYSGYVVGDKVEIATLYQKQSGVLAGVPFVNDIMDHLKCKIEWKIREGTYTEVQKGERKVVAIVTGKARDLLLSERVSLNLIARASGIATKARRLKELAVKEGYKGLLAATRKTTPGFRLVEKYASIVGGCDSHRFDLSSMIMLKDNHIWSTGSITNAVKKAKSAGGFSVKIEVEVSNKKDAIEAILAGADIVMLDNFEPKQLHQVAKELKEEYKGHSFLIEGSGGINEKTVSQFFSPFVDILSLGEIIQGVSHVDFSLKINNKSNL